MEVHSSLGCEWLSGLAGIEQSPDVQDAFWPVPGLMNCDVFICTLTTSHCDMGYPLCVCVTLVIVIWGILLVYICVTHAIVIWGILYVYVTLVIVIWGILYVECVLLSPTCGMLVNLLSLFPEKRRDFLLTSSYQELPVASMTSPALWLSTTSFACTCTYAHVHEERLGNIFREP